MPMASSVIKPRSNAGFSGAWSERGKALGADTESKRSGAEGPRSGASCPVTAVATEGVVPDAGETQDPSVATNRLMTRAIPQSTRHFIQHLSRILSITDQDYPE
jgi:hypothetical protein